VRENETMNDLKKKTFKLVIATPIGISDIRLARKLMDMGATVNESHEAIESLIDEGLIERDSMNYLTNCS